MSPLIDPYTAGLDFDADLDPSWSPPPMPRPEPSDRTAVITIRVSPEFQYLVTQVARRVYGQTTANYLRDVLTAAVERDQQSIGLDGPEKKIRKSGKKVVD